MKSIIFFSPLVFSPTVGPICLSRWWNHNLFYIVMLQIVTLLHSRWWSHNLCHIVKLCLSCNTRYMLKVSIPRLSDKITTPGRETTSTGDRATALGWHHPAAKWEVREASQVRLLSFVIKTILGEVIRTSTPASKFIFKITFRCR